MPKGYLKVQFWDNEESFDTLKIAINGRMCGDIHYACYHACQRNFGIPDQKPMVK